MLPKLDPKDRPSVDGPINDNIFNIVGLSARALKRAKLREYAAEMTSRVMACHSYDEALNLVQEYVDLNP